MRNPKISIFPPEGVPIISAYRVVRRVGRKNLFCDQNFQNDKKFSKFAEIWSEGLPSCLMPIQGSFGQDSQRIRPLSTFQCLAQPCLQDLHFCSANVRAGPIMILHMFKHVFVFFCLHQELLKINFNMREAGLSLNWCHVTWSLPGQCTVFPDFPQL